MPYSIHATRGQKERNVCWHEVGRRGAWALRGAVHGRGRRPRRPACLWAFPLASPWTRRAGDVAPYHGCGHGAGVRTRRGAWALHGAGRGRGRRPRRPACLWAFPMASPWMRRAGDVAPYLCRLKNSDLTQGDGIVHNTRKSSRNWFFRARPPRLHHINQGP